MLARRSGRRPFAADRGRGAWLQRRGVIVRRHRVRVIWFRNHGHVFVSDVFGDEVVGHQPRRRVDDLACECRPEARVTHRGGRGRLIRDAFGKMRSGNSRGSLKGGGLYSDGAGGQDICGGCGVGGRRRGCLFGQQHVLMMSFSAAAADVVVVVGVLLAVVLLVVLFRELTVEVADRSASSGHHRRCGHRTWRIRFGAGGALGGLYEEQTKTII